MGEAAFAMHMKRKRAGFDADAVPNLHHVSGYKLWHLSGGVDYWLGAHVSTSLEEILRAVERSESMNQYELSEDGWDCAQMDRDAGLAAKLRGDGDTPDMTMWEAFLGLRGKHIEIIACSEWD
jgi:hypothetical protein